jgi:hypothetical protein
MSTTDGGARREDLPQFAGHPTGLFMLLLEQAQPIAIEEHVEGRLPGSLAVAEGEDPTAVGGQGGTRHAGSGGACRAPLPCTPVTGTLAAQEPPSA